MSERVVPMLIGGEERETSTSVAVVNPATGDNLAVVPEVDEKAIADALDAAEAGFQVWRRKSPAERKRLILAYADILEADRDRLISILREETGKPQANAEYDFGMLVTCLKYFVEEYERLDQPVLHDPEGRFLHYVLRQPLGVAVGLLAWNFPPPQHWVQAGTSLGCWLQHDHQAFSPNAAGVTRSRSFGKGCRHSRWRHQCDYKQ